MTGLVVLKYSVLAAFFGLVVLISAEILEMWAIKPTRPIEADFYKKSALTLIAAGLLFSLAAYIYLIGPGNVD